MLAILPYVALLVANLVAVVKKEKKEKKEIKVLVPTVVVVCRSEKNDLRVPWVRIH